MAAGLGKQHLVHGMGHATEGQQVCKTGVCDGRMWVIGSCIPMCSNQTPLLRQRKHGLCKRTVSVMQPSPCR
jgi:hypothetical protein